MKPRRPPSTRATRAFVNALRHVLGLDPLYDRGRPTEAQRFYREPARWPEGPRAGA